MVGEEEEEEEEAEGLAGGLTADLIPSLQAIPNRNPILLNPLRISLGVGVDSRDSAARTSDKETAAMGPNADSNTGGLIMMIWGLFI